MKKIISIFVILALALSPAAISATAQAVEFVLGDVNGDGIVSISDASGIGNASFKRERNRYIDFLR